MEKKKESVRYTWQCQEDIETVSEWDENETKMIGGSIYNRGCVVWFVCKLPFVVVQCLVRC